VKGLGAIVMIMGLLGLIFAFSMDTSVSTGYGSVNNLGLMNEKQNYIIVSIGAIFLGFFMVVLAKDPPSALDQMPRPIVKTDVMERPADPAEFPNYLASLGVYKQGGYWCFEKGRTKNMETAIMWAEAARDR
jgi:hypothetical protein